MGDTRDVCGAEASQLVRMLSDAAAAADATEAFTSPNSSADAGGGSQPPHDAFGAAAQLLQLSAHSDRIVASAHNPKAAACMQSLGGVAYLSEAVEFAGAVALSAAVEFGGAVV